MKCQECGDETDELTPFKVGGERMQFCEDCYELKREEAEIAEEAEATMRGMMEYKGG